MSQPSDEIESTVTLATHSGNTLDLHTNTSVNILVIQFKLVSVSGCTAPTRCTCGQRAQCMPAVLQSAQLRACAAKWRQLTQNTRNTRQKEARPIAREVTHQVPLREACSVLCLQTHHTVAACVQNHIVYSTLPQNKQSRPESEPSNINARLNTEKSALTNLTITQG
jgi:hypothetical protein